MYTYIHICTQTKIIYKRIVLYLGNEISRMSHIKTVTKKQQQTTICGMHLTVDN